MMRRVYRCPASALSPADFGFSGALGSHFLAKDIWQQAQGRKGTELWLTLLALAERFKVVQSFLGTKARLENPRLDLVSAMRATAGTLFSSMDAFASAWISGREPLEAPCQGCEPSGDLEPPRLNRKLLY